MSPLRRTFCRPVRLLGALPLCILILLCTTYAQSSSSKKGGITCYAVALEKLVLTDLYYRDGKVIKPLKPQQSRRGKPFQLKTGTTRFDLLVKSPDPEATTPYAVIASTSLPEGAREVLLILDNTPATPATPIGLVALDDTLQGFPPGAIRFANLTGERMYVIINDTPAKLPPNQYTVCLLYTSPSPRDA